MPELAVHERGRDALPPPPTVPLHASPRPALLLDVDGTLVEFAATPESVRVPARTLEVIEALFDRLEGALALVSGRELASIDTLFHPLRLPAAGVHGAQVRLADGSLKLGDAIPGLGLAARAAHGLARGRPGLLVEQKEGFAVALHYRCAPAARMEIEDFAERVVEHHPNLVVQPGNHVLEIRAQGFDKGHAVRTLMASPPFEGRQAWFAGDDLTDEHAFAACASLGGKGVLVGGARATAACHRLQDVDAVLDWLEASLGLQGS